MDKRLVELSATLDELIEFGPFSGLSDLGSRLKAGLGAAREASDRLYAQTPGELGAAFPAKLVGQRTAAFYKGATAGGAAVNPGVASPMLKSGSSAATGGATQSLFEKIRAARSGATPGIAAPVERGPTGAAGIGAATGAPPARVAPVAPATATPPPIPPDLITSSAAGPVAPAAPAPTAPTAPTAPVGPGPAVQKFLQTNVARPSINPGVAPPTGAGTGAGMATGSPTQATAAVQAANAAAGKQAPAMAPWKKWALGGGAVAGAAGAGYLYGSQRQQQMSAWLDDIIQFDRGKFIATGKLMNAPDMSERVRKIFEKAASRPAGNSGIRKFLRGQLAYSQKKDPFSAWKFGAAPRVFESRSRPIEFDTDWKGIFSKHDTDLAPSDAKKRNLILGGAGIANAAVAARNLRHETHPLGRGIYKAGIGAGIFTAGAATKGYADARRRAKADEAKIFESAEEPIWFDNRPRNPMGQFTPEQGGPDPNAMATVYKQPQQQGGGLGTNLLKGGALAIGGGALGAIGGDLGKATTAKIKSLLKRTKKP